jgi:hypothetical protein
MGNKLMPKPAAKPTVSTESSSTGPGSRRLPIRRGYARFGCFLESAVRLAERPHEHGPERLVLHALDQEFGEVASSRSGRGGVP